MINRKSIHERIQILYPQDVEYVYNEIINRIRLFNESTNKESCVNLDDMNAVLITYADTLRGEGKPLRVLKEFLNLYIGDALDSIHLLPFFPFSSDDGFSVIDYKSVNPEVGSWGDIEELSKKYSLMFDAVINHISRESDWVQGFISGMSEFDNFFIVQDPDVDISEVVRPRALPLLTPIETSREKKWVWTTFSDDQIDLNYQNPEVFLKIFDVLLYYIHKGAKLLRLDAIGYLWKELGTSCINLPQTHEIVKLYRDCLQSLKATALLVTETNVPHDENISYFGIDADEAHMIYNFSLPPLVLHAYHKGSSKHLNHWVSNLEYPKADATYFNFLASHDGVGLMPLKGIIESSQIDELITNSVRNGAKISYKTGGDGLKQPYEININFFDALKEPGESLEEHIRKFLGAYFIVFSLKGIPGIYIHSLLGSRNWKEGVVQKGHNRAINRQRLDISELKKELNDSNSLRHKVFYGMKQMIETRKIHASLSHKGIQRVRIMDERLFVLERYDNDEQMIAIVNLSRDKIDVKLEDITGTKKHLNAMSGQMYQASLTVDAYDYLWLIPQRG